MARAATTGPSHDDTSLPTPMLPGGPTSSAMPAVPKVDHDTTTSSYPNSDAAGVDSLEPLGSHCELGVLPIDKLCLSQDRTSRVSQVHENVDQTSSVRTVDAVHRVTVNPSSGFDSLLSFGDWLSGGDAREVQGQIERRYWNEATAARGAWMTPIIAYEDRKPFHRGFQLNPAITLLVVICFITLIPVVLSIIWLWINLTLFFLFFLALLFLLMS